MLVGKFNKALKEYDVEFIRGAYAELKILEETGSFPVGQKYFRKLCDLRNQLYNDGRNIDATRKDLLDEIACRWYERK